MGKSSMPPVGHGKCSVEPEGAHLLRPHQVHQACGMLGVPADTAGFLDVVQGVSQQCFYLLLEIKGCGPLLLLVFP